MIASYLLCCAIIAATMGGENFIEISSTGSKKAVVAGKVRYFGETTHMTSVAASAVAVEGIHEISEPLGEGTTLKLYPECSLSDEVKYLDWTVKCPKAAPEADGLRERGRIARFYSQITKITISGTKTGIADRPPEEIDAESIAPPKTQYVFDELCKPGKPEPWVRSYWETLHVFLTRAWCAEITSFLRRMSALIKKYKEARDRCNYECKAEMSKIYDRFIDKDSPEAKCELNMNQALRDALKTPRNKEGEPEDAWAGITPESSEWKAAMTNQINYLVGDKLVAFVGSSEYKAWLLKEDGRAYRRMLDVPREDFVAPATGIVDAGPDTVKAVQLDNNVYRRRVYRRRAYDRYDVAIAYLRGYNNGLLERLKKYK